MTSSPADIALVPVDATANPASEQDSSILDPNNSEEGDHDAGYTRPWKGKEREVEMVEEEEPDDDDKVEKLDYPPTNEEDAETRRIEENLRRWEIAERRRRKTARESISVRPHSFVEDVANFIWPARKSPETHRRGDPSLGKHVVLQDRESMDAASLENVAPSLPHSPTTSPRPSSEQSTQLGNPFASPQDFSSQGPLMNSEPPTPQSPPAKTVTVDEPVTPVFGPASSIPRRMPTPKPLGLPPPRTPPPLTDTPPPATPPPEIRSHPEPPSPAEPKSARWWHDWLCGCGEGPDRGGDDQAGRTNPFE